MNDHEITWDGKSVWVNSEQDGSSIGRFSRFGVDVHVTASEQMETGKQCLECSTDGSFEGWKLFCEAMRKHYRVNVPKEARPKYLDEQLPDRHCISCGHGWNRKQQGQGSICPGCHSRNITNLRMI